MLFAGSVFPTSAQGEMAGRRLDFRIGDGFGDADPRDIEAVLRSAAETIWLYCPDTRWEVPGFFIYHHEEHPITLYQHRADGRIAIGLTPRGRLWSQFAYQFAHEFCHALVGHSNDWKKPQIRVKKANHWLEESLCETASIFALRLMAREWEKSTPYANWKSYAASLKKYAIEHEARIQQARGESFVFDAWFAQQHESIRSVATDRQKNSIVALQVLPLFEAEPAGWESLTSYNLGDPNNPGKTLHEHLVDWRAVAPASQRGFIGKLAAVFGVVL